MQSNRRHVLTALLVAAAVLTVAGCTANAIPAPERSADTTVSVGTTPEDHPQG